MLPLGPGKYISPAGRFRAKVGQTTNGRTLQQCTAPKHFRGINLPLSAYVPSLLQNLTFVLTSVLVPINGSTNRTRTGSTPCSAAAPPTAATAAARLTRHLRDRRSWTLWQQTAQYDLSAPEHSCCHSPPWPLLLSTGWVCCLGEDPPSPPPMTSAAAGVQLMQQ